MPRVCGTCGRAVGDAAYCPFCSHPTIEQFPSPISQSALVTRSDALTIRKLFERKKRWFNVILFGNFALFIGAGFVADLLKVSPGCFIVPSFAIFAITALYAGLCAFRCPQCENNWGQLTNGWRIDEKIRHCPFCGVDIDVEIDPETYKPIEFLKKEWGQQGVEIKSTDIQLSGKLRSKSEIQLPPGKEGKGIGKEEKGIL